MLYLNNYGPYAELVQNERMVIDVNTITIENWDLHFNSILNIMRDSIETELCSSVFITVRFDRMDVDLSIIDYWFNLLMWYMLIRVRTKLQPYHLFFDEHITKMSIKNWVDIHFITPNRKILANKMMNNIIDDCIHKLSIIDEFSFFLANTINLEDFIDLMNEVPEFDRILHTDLSNIPIGDVANANAEALKRSIHILMNSNHSLSNFFKAKEGISPKQYKEVGINIGTKPDGKGGVFPTVINTNYLIGGVNDHLSNFIESSTGRLAQIIVEGNVGISGYFARLLGLNSLDSILHDDPDYICDTKNLQQVTINSMKILGMLENRYYRFTPNGMEYLIRSKELDANLLGQTILLRSPITCSSVGKNGKICYRCYGDLAYTNRDINIGKIAAELISSKITQRMLSAKHLLESFMKLIEWSNGFNDIFEIDYNLIKTKDIMNKDLSGYKLIIDPIEVEDMRDDEEDASRSESEYAFYVNEFKLVYPDGRILDIHTSNSDNIYLTHDLITILTKSGYDDGHNLELDLKVIQEADIQLFAIHLLNNDISASLDKIKSVIDNSAVMKNNNRHSVHQSLLESLIDGDIDVMGVHAELILSNQLRSDSDILLTPQWQYEDEPYKLLSLKQALRNHPSVTVSLSYERIKTALYNPLTFRKTKPSVMDLYFMPNPQKFLYNNSLLEASKNKPVEQIRQKGYKVPLFKRV